MKLVTSLSIVASALFILGRAGVENGLGYFICVPVCAFGLGWCLRSLWQDSDIARRFWNLLATHEALPKCCAVCGQVLEDPSHLTCLGCEGKAVILRARRKPALREN